MEFAFATKLHSKASVVHDLLRGVQPAISVILGSRHERHLLQPLYCVEGLLTHHFPSPSGQLQF
jgi:hypothetical protein